MRWAVSLAIFACCNGCGAMILAASNFKLVGSVSIPVLKCITNEPFGSFSETVLGIGREFSTKYRSSGLSNLSESTEITSVLPLASFLAA